MADQSRHEVINIYILPQNTAVCNGVNNMEFKKMLAKEVGKFCISIESNDDGNGKTHIEGNALAIIGGMTTLAHHIAKMFRDKGDTVYPVYLLSMLQALAPDSGDDKQSESESGQNMNLSDVRPLASPNQEEIDAMFDRLFGR